MATSDVLSFPLQQPLWKQPPLQGQAKRREQGLVVFPLPMVSEGGKQNYCGHRGNQSSDLWFFHNHRTPRRTLRSAGTQTYLLQWKPASAGVWGDRLLHARQLKSKLTLAKDTGGKLLSVSKAMFCNGANGLGCSQRLIPSELLGTSIRKMRSKQLELWFLSGISGWTPPHWPSSEARFILSRERKPLTVARLSWSRTNKNWRSNRSSLLRSASREKSGFYYKIPAWSFLPQDRPRRPRLVWINQK